jgi:hypothetical protein
MDVQSDPFSFGVAIFALAIAVVQLYWNRPQHRAQVCSIPSPFDCNIVLTTRDADGRRTLRAAWSSIKVRILSRQFVTQATAAKSFSHCRRHRASNICVFENQASVHVLSVDYCFRLLLNERGVWFVGLFSHCCNHTFHRLFGRPYPSCAFLVHIYISCESQQ